MSEVVVIGAGGFIGRAVCARLEAVGHRAHRVLRGQPLPAAPGAACLHLAGSNDPSVYESDAALKEARELAAKVLAAGYGRVVYASTAQVYGGGYTRPVAEDAAPAPESAYARLKLSLEPLFSTAPHAVARLSNIYGPGQAAVNVLSHVLRQFPGDGVMRLQGSPDAVRVYLFVDDAAQALIALALSPDSGNFNISTGRGTSVAALIELLAKVHGVAPPRIESAGGKASQLVLDPGKAAARLGWRAKVSLENGLATLLSGIHR